MGGCDGVAGGALAEGDSPDAGGEPAGEPDGDAPADPDGEAAGDPDGDVPVDGDSAGGEPPTGRGVKIRPSGAHAEMARTATTRAARGRETVMLVTLAARWGGGSRSA